MTNIQKGSTSDLTFNFDQIENISAKPTNTNVLRQNLFLYARVFGEKTIRFEYHGIKPFDNRSVEFFREPRVVLFWQCLNWH